MHQDPAAVVIDVSDNRSTVVALVEAGETADGVLQRAVAEAARRCCDLLVLQLVDDPSVVRRAVAKAVLARDVAWWSRDLAHITASIGTVPAEAARGTVHELDDAACVVVDPDLLTSERPLAALGRHVLGVSAPKGFASATEDGPNPHSPDHPWPAVVVVPTDHSR